MLFSGQVGGLCCFGAKGQLAVSSFNECLACARSPCWLEELEREENVSVQPFDHLLGGERRSSSPVMSVSERKDAGGFPDTKDEPPSQSRKGLGQSQARELCRQREGEPELPPSGQRRPGHMEKTARVQLWRM